MASSIANIFKIQELRKRILFTLALLAVYRIGIFVSTPGANRAVMKQVMRASSGTFLGLFNMFSGGALEQLSIFALGIMPYISASIILQLLTVVVPALERLQKEGQQGQKKINQYTRYGTIILSLVQSFFIARYFEGLNRTYGQYGTVVANPGIAFELMTMMSLTTGTCFIMWLGEQITERGIGNGISLIIFANIVAKLPQTLTSTLVSSSSTAQGSSTGSLVTVVVLGALALILIFVMVYVYLAQRRVPVQYPTKRRVMEGMRSGSQTTYIPLAINSAGMIPLIFASSLLLLPVIVSQYLVYSTNKGLSSFFTNVRLFLDPSTWWYWVIYGGLVFAFTFFYAIVIWEQQNLAENLQKQGAFVPGIRPGPPTARHLYDILKRVTFGGAVFLGVISIAPALVNRNSATQVVSVAGLLIVVGVVLDTVNQIQAQMVMRNYSGFLR